MTGANGGGGVEVEGAKLANKLYPEVNGQKIELVIVDNKSDKVEAANAGKRLVEQDKVKAIIGSWGSGLSMSAGATFQAAKVPAVAASATNPNVTLNNPYYFRVCFIDPFRARCSRVSPSMRLKAKKVSVIQEITTTTPSAWPSSSPTSSPSSAARSSTAASTTRATPTSTPP